MGHAHRKEDSSMSCIPRSHSALAVRSLPRLARATFVAGAMLLGATATHAGGTPQQQCDAPRFKAAGKYVACQQKAAAKEYSGRNDPNAFDEPYQLAIGKCTLKYAAVWTKLQAKASGTGSTCDAARFVDNGDGTVTDNLTGLQWEQKTNDATVHDQNNNYSWSAASGDTTTNGTAFTLFLAALNGACFGGQCDWRLPTPIEMQTILSAPYPCASSPCVDELLFGPTSPASYWSGTDAHVFNDAWVVSFGDGFVLLSGKLNQDPVRAVRGGL
jgi:hypothetical protein